MFLTIKSRLFRIDLFRQRSNTAGVTSSWLITRILALPVLNPCDVLYSSWTPSKTTWKWIISGWFWIPSVFWYMSFQYFEGWISQWKLYAHEPVYLTFWDPKFTLKRYILRRSVEFGALILRHTRVTRYTDFPIWQILGPAVELMVEKVPKASCKAGAITPLIGVKRPQLSFYFLPFTGAPQLHS